MKKYLIKSFTLMEILNFFPSSFILINLISDLRLFIPNEITFKFLFKAIFLCK